MTNHEKYIKNATLDDLAEFICGLTSLFNPNNCTGCPVQDYCDAHSEEFTTRGCLGTIKDWLDDYPDGWSNEWGISHYRAIQSKSIDEAAAFLGSIADKICSTIRCNSTVRCSPTRRSTS